MKMINDDHLQGCNYYYVAQNVDEPINSKSANTQVVLAPGRKT